MDISSEENVECLEDDVIEVDNSTQLNEDLINKPEDNVPKVGMKFKDVDEIFTFYKRYAYHSGFPVRKRNSKKDNNGLLKHVTFTCSREGQRLSTTSTSLKPNATIQTGCRARVCAVSDLEGVWGITTVILEHNHKCSPTKSRMYRCNREISEHVKKKLEVNDIAGIPLHKSFNSVVVEAGGYDNVRRLRLGEGDAVAIQAYFSKMQAQCPGFFFNIDLDEESRLKNVFWADNRCRETYKEFGDVVTFDTTYLTNRYEMPFAPFVGVNHHGQSILLGCGLISNEDTQTFVWLFRTWLECMGGQSPMGIITDQDRAMQNAIQIVFPNTRHRWCLWHILKKLPEKFGGNKEKEAIHSTIHDVVYDSQSPESFEYSWRLMIEEYALEDNDWLAGLYAERSRWVPCYLKTSFWAGMSTTQRSESINAFFDGYVHSKTSLKQFVEQYERALQSKVEKEVKAEFKSFSQKIPCATKYGMEKQFQSAFTISKFSEFQQEFSGMVYCRIVSEINGDSTSMYEVLESVILGERMIKKKFIVSFEKPNLDLVCSCHLFEFKGILCKHAITVFISNDITLVPEKYIFRRWRQDVTRTYMRAKINYNGWVNTPSQVRYDELCANFTKIADLVADDEAQSKDIKDWLAAKMKDLNVSRSKSVGGISSLTQNNVVVAPEQGPVEKVSNVPLKDPKLMTRKGAPKKNRKKSFVETSSKRTKVNPNKVKSKPNEEFGSPSYESVLPTSTGLSFSQQLMHVMPKFTMAGELVNLMPTSEHMI